MKPSTQIADWQIQRARAERAAYQYQIIQAVGQILSAKERRRDALASKT